MKIALMVRVSLASFSALMALCFLNRPRFWWQETLCNLSLYAVPLIMASLVVTATSIRRRRPGWAVALLGGVSSLYCVYVIAATAVPLFRTPRWGEVDTSSRDSFRILFVDDCQIADTNAREMLVTYQPEVAVVIGAARERFLAEGKELVNRRDFAGDKVVSVVSSLSLQERGAENLGFQARPGGVVAFQLPGGTAVDLGVLKLGASTTRGDFERNRISARRLASYMRNADSVRMVVGSFHSTPFSQFTSVFTSQARLRSLWRGKGLVKTYDMKSLYSRFSYSHGFVSRDIRPLRVERVVVPGCSYAGIFAELTIAKPEDVAGPSRPPESTIDDTQE